MQHAMLGQAADWRKLQRNGAKSKYALALPGLGFPNPLKIVTRGRSDHALTVAREPAAND
jgi:hypothetical protein